MSRNPIIKTVPEVLCFFCLFFFFPTPLQEFDKKYNPTWHCIVGRNFGSYVTHETKHFIYFYLGQVAILLFKSGWKSCGESRMFVSNMDQDALVASVLSNHMLQILNKAIPWLCWLCVTAWAVYHTNCAYVEVKLLFSKCPMFIGKAFVSGPDEFVHA